MIILLEKNERSVHLSIIKLIKQILICDDPFI